MAKKESRGRQKIKMARIKNSSHRQVSFSKRRLGLFKKASEICTLCGLEAVVIIYSPGQKIFSFGYPNVESLIDRFLSRNPCTQTSDTARNLKNLQQGPDLRELNSQLTQMLDLLEDETNRGEAFNSMRKSSENKWWWVAPIDNLGLHELEVLGASMEDLKKSIANQAMFLESTSNSSVLGTDGGVGVASHFNLRSLEAKVDEFCLAHQE
ncbi:hypothetical protein Cgig2_025864 [Carnegiea gigantea]|uniref:MADS-box domain-containing protein n=1 Tax=Carnegiea gigantea TaxID=171969 RepID=A0A9Q1Q5W9_9CARY|nr:hypothetical protein Cgig2_025864 [Carnegiea gigantea]